MQTDPLTSPTGPTRADRRLLRQTVHAHTLGILLAGLLALVIALWIWARLARALLQFGLHIDFDRLHVAGPEAMAILHRVNPWFWWAVVVLATLIVLRILWAIGRRLMAHARQRPVRSDAFNRLVQQLSVPALDVLLWAWSTPDEPLRVGNVQQAADELAAHRASRLQTARAQRKALEDALQGRLP